MMVGYTYKDCRFEKIYQRGSDLGGCQNITCSDPPMPTQAKYSQ
jgi:hypothetical protein